MREVNSLNNGNANLLVPKSEVLSVRQSTEYAYTYFWMSLRGHKKISIKYSLYIELWLYFTGVATSCNQRLENR